MTTPSELLKVPLVPAISVKVHPSKPVKDQLQDSVPSTPTNTVVLPEFKALNPHTKVK
jgi:hypothetical protein